MSCNNLSVLVHRPGPGTCDSVTWGRETAPAHPWQPRYTGTLSMTNYASTINFWENSILQFANYPRWFLLYNHLYFSLQCTGLWSGILASLSSVLSSLCDREQRSPCPAHNHDNYAPAVGGMHDLFNSGIYVTSLHTVTLVTGKLRDKRKFKWVVGHFIVMCSLWWSGHGNIDSIVAHFHPCRSVESFQ